MKNCVLMIFLLAVACSVVAKQPVDASAQFAVDVYPLSIEPVAHWTFADGTFSDRVGELDGTSKGNVEIVDSEFSRFPKAIQFGSEKGFKVWSV